MKNAALVESGIQVISGLASQNVEYSMFAKNVVFKSLVFMLRPREANSGSLVRKAEEIWNAASSSFVQKPSHL